MISKEEDVEEYDDDANEEESALVLFRRLSVRVGLILLPPLHLVLADDKPTVVFVGKEENVKGTPPPLDDDNDALVCSCCCC